MGVDYIKYLYTKIDLKERADGQFHNYFRQISAPVTTVLQGLGYQALRRRERPVRRSDRLLTRCRSSRITYSQSRQEASGGSFSVSFRHLHLRCVAMEEPGKWSASLRRPFIML